ncbi:metalloprotease [Pseudomonas sp. MAFF 730085]|uniref:Metalloprotease n=1 Tax=Pseudomonas kitaguniensis TaxID=2607908 RepID=A0A5N7JXU9_9PSED|nr:M57 family metalloprotease [Pseudomonas kitaguniensis]MPQ86186.1 metalloprotease [Pseudomonas kitaguniensis]
MPLTPANTAARFHPLQHNVDNPTTPIKRDVPTASLPGNIATQLTRENYRINDRNGDGQITVGYSFLNASDAQAAHSKNGGALAFSEARKKSFRSSIRAWEDVVKVKFIENAKNADALVVVHGNNGVGGYATLPTDHSKNMTIGIGLGDKNSPLNSSMIHEIGHSLGLRHPTGEHLENNKTHTAMSYRTDWWRPHDERGVSVSDSTSTPMMHDITAGQRLYGANQHTRTGDTTYGFNSNSERDYYSLTSADELAAFCVWDNGGNDTLDFSGFKHNQKINLNAGQLSNVGGREGNVSIAKGVVVENAIGGDGEDLLIGNHVGNRITGGAGGDELYGGGNANTFVYQKASDSTLQRPDVLQDFVSGVDKIDLSSVLKEAGISKLSFSETPAGEGGSMSDQKGELMLDYDQNVKLYRLALNVGGGADSTVVILSKNPIRPSDILTDTRSHSSIAPLPQPQLTPHKTFNFDAVSDSSYINSQLLMNFTTGEDKIDLSNLSKNTQVTFNRVNAYTGRIGDTVLTLNTATNRYYIGIDMTGNRRTDFLIRSTTPIRCEDVIGVQFQ